MNKLFILLSIFTPAVMASGQIYYDGGVYEHKISLLDAVMQNTPGAIHLTSWNSNGGISLGKWYIDCKSLEAEHLDTAAIFSAEYSFPGQVNEGWVKFDEYWSISAKVWIDGGRSDYLQVPFKNESNLNRHNDTCTSLGKRYPLSTLATGSKGQVSFKLEKKIISGYDFISRPIINIAGHSNPSYLSPSMVNIDMSKPFTRVVIDSFKVTLPEKCEINAGQSLDIDFGNVATTKLDGTNYEKIANLEVKCSNGDFDSGLNSIYADYIGDAAFSDQYFGSDNNKVAVVVKDANRQIVKPGDRKMLSLTGGEANFELSLAPISDGQKAPEGEFNANIIIRLNLE